MPRRIVNRSRRGPAAQLRYVLGALVMSFLPGSLTAQDDLCGLADLHAPAGREQAAIDYVRQRLGERADTDNTGSVSITYGRGPAQTLLIAGLDEPGYVVSGITGEGYLRLQRLVDPTPHYQFDTFFQGWPVQVTTKSGAFVAGVVAAPSVHFDRNGPAPRGVDGLYVDLGATSRDEVTKAGVSVLDGVTLDKSCGVVGERGEATAPWISSRAGAAVLLRLAGLLEKASPQNAVTLAFVTAQYYHNAGLQRVVQRVASDRVVLFRPGNSEATSIGAAAGTVADFSQQLLDRAKAVGLEARRADGPTLPFGPFGPRSIWRDSQQVTVIAPAVEHSGTPSEAIDRAELERIARLLAGHLGVEWREQQPTARTERPNAIASPREGSAFVSLIRQLSELYGVSGAEGPVRAWIQTQLPGWARERSTVDQQGNLIVRLGRNEKPRAVFVAHMDEIGFAVTRDASERSVAAESRGGGMAELFAWHPFWIHTATRQLPAVMTRHGSLDIGAGESSGAPRVSNGDTATVRKTFRTLLGNRITARSLDDRIGCAALLSTLQTLDAAAVRKLDEGNAVWFVFSVEEEAGLLGARFVAERTSPRRVYPVDSFVTSDTPLEDQRIAYTPLGEGFVIRAMDSSGITPRDAVERVVELAKRRGIPYQFGVTAGGNDGSTFVPHGAVNIPLSFALRYAHSPGEVADLRDAQALQAIVAALLEAELAGGLD
jgi:putative aminopeptidase FrvX